MNGKRAKRLRKAVYGASAVVVGHRAYGKTVYADDKRRLYRGMKALGGRG